MPGWEIPRRSGKNMRNRRASWAVLAFLCCGVFAASGRANQQQQTQTAASQRQTEQSQQQRQRQRASEVQISSAAPLVAQNLNEVAASADEIRAVLASNPGLMIEIKRLLAMRASNHGQLLTENDLTDQAIYDKLSSDVEFRSAATQLLQHYGYLLPTYNPKSEVGQERQLLIQQRAIQLARMQQQQNAGVGPSTQAAACNPSQNANCLPAVPNQAPPAMPMMPGALPSNPQQVPFTPPPSVGRQEMVAGLSNQAPTGTTPGELGALATQGAGNGSGLPTSPGLGENAGLGQAAGAAAYAAGMGSAFGNTQQFAQNQYAMGVSANEGMATGGAQPAVFNAQGQPAVAPYGYSYRWWNQQAYEEAPARLVRREDPFAGIPSLYDMYMQGTTQTAKPQRFGLAVFRDQTASNQIIPMDLPVGPSYVLGPGDGLTVDLWGGISERLHRVVDRTGRVALPEVGPVEVSGRTLAEVQRMFQRLLRTQFRNVSVDVSISRLRTVRVYVVGDVEHPGAYDVSSLSTPLNAEFAAGGPTNIGSLRVVQHWRGNKLLQTIDVYDLLLRGVTHDILPLSNGDTVRVPTLGPQVTVEGMVRRPDIYELKNETNLAQVIRLAGGILPTATLKNIEVQRVVAHEKRIMLSLSISDASNPAAVEKQLAAFHVENGDVVHVFPMIPYNQDAVYLEGHVVRPGKYAYRQGMTIDDLIHSYKDLLPQPSAYAEIIRLEPPAESPVVESFNLRKALANPAMAPKLDPLDTVRIFGEYDFQDVPTVWVSGEVRRPGLYRTSGRVRVRDAVELAGGLAPDADLHSAQVFHYLPNSQLKVISVNLAEAMEGNPADNLLLGPRDRVLVHRNLARTDPATVYVKGDVVRPGRYPLTVGMRLSDLIRVGGGLKRSADPTQADLTRYLVHPNGNLTGEHFTVNPEKVLAGNAEANLHLQNGDTLTIEELPGWQDIGASVSVSGEVAHPGVYGIRPGERLASVLERAGGFLPDAYPQGIVFERESVRKLQQEKRQDLIQELRQESGSFKTSLQTTAAEQAQLQQASYEQTQRAIQALEQAPVTGRMVITMPPNLRRFQNSPDNITLLAGDTIYIPKHPDFVLVTGQVYNSNAITYMPDRNASWYLAQAGGPTPEANKKNIFVIRANGSIVSNSSSGWWLHGSVLGTQIEPGDTVVVPERPVGGNVFWRNLVQIAQVASSAAVTAAVATNY